MPKVSVIIGTYNSAHFLADCLSSVKAQTYKDYEVIVVDDGSTDNTKELIDGMNWDKIRYFYQENSGAITLPRNNAIRHAKGEYVAFLDADDLWYPKKLEKIMGTLLMNPEIDIMSHHLLLKKEGKSIGIVKNGPLRKDMFKQLLFCGNCLTGSATVTKKSVMLEINGFDDNERYFLVEDYEAWLRIAHKKKKFYFLDECLGEYRVHKNNVSRDYSVSFPNRINVVKKHFRNYKSKNPIKYIFYGRVLGDIYYDLAWYFYAQKEYLKGFFSVIKAILCNPFCLCRYFLRIFSLLKRVIKR